MTLPLAGAPACEQLPGEMGPGGYYGHYQALTLPNATVTDCASDLDAIQP